MESSPVSGSRVFDRIHGVLLFFISDFVLGLFTSSQTSNFELLVVFLLIYFVWIFVDYGLRWMIINHWNKDPVFRILLLDVLDSISATIIFITVRLGLILISTQVIDMSLQTKTLVSIIVAIVGFALISKARRGGIPPSNPPLPPPSLLS